MTKSPFVWAFPHQYRPQAAAGTRVSVDLGSGGVWSLLCQGNRRWDLQEGSVEHDVAASLSAGDEAGWKLLTGAVVPSGGVTVNGPNDLLPPLLLVRGIIVYATEVALCAVGDVRSPPRVALMPRARGTPARLIEGPHSSFWPGTSRRGADRQRRHPDR